VRKYCEIEGFIPIDNVMRSNKKDTVFYLFSYSQLNFLDHLLMIVQKILKDEERINLWHQNQQENFEDNMSGLLDDPDDFFI
jgi:hypothetical protein